MRVSSYLPRLALAGVVLAALLAGATACRESESVEQTMQVRSAAKPARADVRQVREWLSEDPELVVLDSRSEGGWQSAATKARGAIRVPPHDVASRLSDIPRDVRIIVYCT
ncbi:MAG: hypothetical protein ABIG03_02265 [Candidatus Eisenbacteria bacterium]